MSEITIPRDIHYADLIDANCDQCISGEGNGPQIESLAQRSQESPYPREKEALRRYALFCNRCSQTNPNNDSVDTLKSRHSCSYRTGF